MPSESAVFGHGRPGLHNVRPGDESGGLRRRHLQCDALIDFPLASQASCVWFSNTRLAATLQSGAIIVPVTMSRTPPRIATNACSIIAVHRLLVLASQPLEWRRGPPDTPLSPQHIFEGMTTIGSCSNFELNGAASVGSGGRDWVLADWMVNSTTLPWKNFTTVTKLYADTEDEWEGSILDWVDAYDATSKVFVPTQLLLPGNTYEFKLRLANFLGFEAVSEPWFVSVAAQNPMLSSAAAPRSRPSGPRVTLFAQASTAVCPGETPGPLNLEYRWKSETFEQLTSASSIHASSS